MTIYTFAVVYGCPRMRLVELEQEGGGDRASVANRNYIDWMVFIYKCEECFNEDRWPFQGEGGERL